MSTNNKWQALSMKDRAFLIREAVRNGITDIDSIRDLYNQSGEQIRLGTPYRTFESGSDYDYFNAAPENMPQEDDGHWGSRNPHTGQLLKSPNHPTYNLLLEGEKQAGYKIQKIGDREYSFPNEHRFDGESNYPARNSQILFRSPAIVDSEQEYIPLSFSNYLESIIEPVEENTQSKPIQERPITILSDNATANFRDKVARTYGNKKDSHNFNINIGPGELSKCAKYVSDYASNASGLDPEETGVYGNAWTMFGNIEKKGGAPIFNIYTDPEFADIRRSGDYKKLIEETKSRKGSLKSEYSKLQPGDVVGIFNPSSSYHTTTMREGSTFNSHVGIVSEINKEGIPIIAHTVNARDRKDPITALTGSAWGQPFVTVAARPNYTNPIKELDFNDSIVSSYEVPFIPNEESEHEKSAYRDMQTYMNSLAQAKETFRNIYPDVDWDNLEKAAIGILKRETNYMRTKQSDIALGEVGDFSDRLATLARRTYHSFKDTPQENRSRDLTKFKFNTLPLSYRKAIGLNSPEQLDKDPKITARAVLLQLGRIYDYYNRLFAKYPELGGTNEDKLNIAILSYNEGGKYHMGFDPKTGEIKPEELNKLRQISRQGYITKDISSTNYKYLNRIIPGLGDWAYDKYGDYRPGYIAAARKQMNELSESRQGHRFSGEENNQIENSQTSKINWRAVGSTAYDILETVDPTGISSWITPEGDLYQAVQGYKNGTVGLGEVALQTVGALPILGPVGKAIKLGKGMSKASKVVSKAISNSKVVDDFLELIPGVKKVASATQAVTGIPIQAAADALELSTNARWAANKGIQIINSANTLTDAGSALYNGFNREYTEQNHNNSTFTQNSEPYTSSEENHMSITEMALEDANRRLQEVENSKNNKKGGWKEQEKRWYPHKSHEGGAKTVGYGIKLLPKSKWTKIVEKQGYLTEDQEIEARRELLIDCEKRARNYYDSRFGKGEFDKLDFKPRSLLIDKVYNVGNLSKFPNFVKAIHDGDMQGMYKEYKVYTTIKENGIEKKVELGRNKTLKSELDSLNQGLYRIFIKK